MMVIADTSPVSYLIRIGEIECCRGFINIS